MHNSRPHPRLHDRPQLGRSLSGHLCRPGRKRGELADLGITAVELLPVDEFDENDCPFVNPLTGEKLRNFWGYNPIVFCAPKAAYANNPERYAPWHEFCAMVDAVPTKMGSR